MYPQHIQLYPWWNIYPFSIYSVISKRLVLKENKQVSKLDFSIFYIIVHAYLFKNRTFYFNHRYYFSVPAVWCPAGFLTWLSQLVSGVGEGKANYHLWTYSVLKALCIITFNPFDPEEDCAELHSVVWLQSLCSPGGRTLHHITSRIPLWSLSVPLVEQRKQEWFLRKWYE